MKELNLSNLKAKKSLHSHLESPFQEKNGLLEFKEGFTSPEFFSHWSFVANLYGENVRVDHCVLTFSDLPSLKTYAQALHSYHAQIVEGPGLFPLEFCQNNYTLTTDLWIHLITVLMPSGGLLVLAAPHTQDDQLDRFLRQRGQSAVHHVAIRVYDINWAALRWHEKEFIPLSEEPLEGESLSQWFLRNSAGQIIELIERRPNNNATFECQNIGGLRRSEVSM